MSTFNPNRTKPELIGIRTTKEQRELFTSITNKLGKNNGETFDLMVDITDMILNKSEVTLEEVRGVLNGNK